VLPGGEKGLLDGVLSVLGRAKDAVTVQLKLAPVSFDQLRKGISVASLCPGDEVRFDVSLPCRVVIAARSVRLLI